MSGQWKPGDVAMVTRAAWHGLALFTERGWVDVNGGADNSPPYADVTNARTLVVIDPESREQVERLAQALWLHADVRTPAEEYQARVRAVLRSLIAPPKPEEPTGLGAVVEDADGGRHVRVNTACWIRKGGGTTGRSWGEIAAVRVLSEGVVA